MLKEIVTDIHELPYYDINGANLERWFQNNSLANLPTEINVVIVIDNAKCHNQLV